MITYSKDGIVRIYWNKNNSTQYGLYINESTLPTAEPESETRMYGMFEFHIPASAVGVYTFDIGKDSDVESVERIIESIEGENKDCISFVKMGSNGSFESYFVSDPSPELGYSIFNYSTLLWETPDNVEELKQRDKLFSRREEILNEFSRLDCEIIRPFTEGEKARVKEIIKEKNALRKEFKEIGEKLSLFP